MPELDRAFLNSIGTVGFFGVVALYVWSRRFPARVLLIAEVMAALVLILAVLRFFIYIVPVLAIADASTINSFAPWIGLALLIGMLVAQRRRHA